MNVVNNESAAIYIACATKYLLIPSTYIKRKKQVPNLILKDK